MALTTAWPTIGPVLLLTLLSPASIVLRRLVSSDALSFSVPDILSRPKVSRSRNSDRNRSDKNSFLCHLLLCRKKRKSASSTNTTLVKIGVLTFYVSPTSESENEEVIDA